MIANISVITDNLDYLLWGRAAQGQPGSSAHVTDGNWRCGAGTARRDSPRLLRVAVPGRGAQGTVCLGGVYSRYSAHFVIFWMWYLLPMLTGSDLRGRRPSRWR